MRENSEYDVIIIGAGIAGCATAAALRQADRYGRRKILLVDRYRGVHPRFSGEFIHPRGAQVLADLGFYEPLRRAGAIDVDGFAVFEHADARHVDLAYAVVPEQRPRGLSVHHKTLVRIMRQELLTDPCIDLVEGQALVELIRDADGSIAGVILENNRKQRWSVRSDLVVGADGKGSTVRKLAPIPDTRATIGFTVGLEVVNATLPRPTYAHVFLGAWGPVLAYPIERRQEGIITRITFDLPRELPVKGQRLKDHLLRAYLPFLPSRLSQQVAAAIANHHGQLEMAPTVNLPAPSATLPGLVLVGDAAGCSHPITASGMTMALRDAETLGGEARRRADVPGPEMWLDAGSLRRYRTEHDRYVPTRQALADAIYEAFRGGDEGSRAIRRALFEYWESGPAARTRSMALLSCAERRPSVFLSEYLKTARHAVEASVIPRHARNFPVGDRMRRAKGAFKIASTKFGLVARVMWANIRPGWFPSPLPDLRSSSPPGTPSPTRGRPQARPSGAATGLHADAQQPRQRVA